MDSLGKGEKGGMLGPKEWESLKEKWKWREATEMGEVTLAHSSLVIHGAVNSLCPFHLLPFVRMDFFSHLHSIIQCLAFKNVEKDAGRKGRRGRRRKEINQRTKGPRAYRETYKTGAHECRLLFLNQWKNLALFQNSKPSMGQLLLLYGGKTS